MMTQYATPPTKYAPAGVLHLLQYQDGGTALRVFSEGGEPLYTATVNIHDMPPPPGCVWLKGWAENEGVPEALQACGAVAMRPFTWDCGHAQAQLARLAPELAKAARKQAAARAKIEPAVREKA